MFYPIRSDTGAVLPYEQHPAAAGTYASGMLLTYSNGKLSVADNPEASTKLYLCVSNDTVADGGLLTVAAARSDVVYRCPLEGAQDQSAGDMLGVSGGKQLSADAANKIFQITAIMEDNIVEGRFIK